MASKVLKSTTMKHEMEVDNAEQAAFNITPPGAWYKDAGLLKLYAMIIIPLLNATTNGYDGSLLNGLQTMEPWQNYFDNPSGSTLGLFSAILQVGSFSAIFFSSYLADLLGRRAGIAVGMVVLLVGVVLQVVPTVDTGMYIGGRFLVGMGSNIAQGSAPLLILELAHPAHRGKVTTMYNTLWCVGAIVAAWTVFGTTSYTSSAAWRIPTAVQAVMPLIQLIGIWLLPESPRWLVSKDRHEQALKVLAKFHANGDEQNSLVQSEYLEIRETLRAEKEFSSQGWKGMVSNKGNRRRITFIALVSFFSQCSGNGLVSYYLHDILESVGMTDSYDQALFNGGLQIYNFLVAVLFSVLLVDRLGRRKLFLIAAGGMLVTFSIWTACSAVYSQTGNKGAGKAVLAMIFLFYGMAGFAWPGLTVAYPAEILPFNIRAKGMALIMAFQSLASVVLNQYVNPIGLKTIAWKFYFVYIVILLIECIVIYMYFPETRGLTLEEVGRLLDDDEMSDVVQSRMEKVASIEFVHHEVVGEDKK
ncbi:general substrate transporter, partial [Aureobasidium melanogenum]